MKLWLVLMDIASYDGDLLLGVCTSEEAALKLKDEQKGDEIRVVESDSALDGSVVV